jgi:hypothetical protein
LDIDVVAPETIDVSRAVHVAIDQLEKLGARQMELAGHFGKQRIVNRSVVGPSRQLCGDSLLDISAIEPKPIVVTTVGLHKAFIS